MNRSQKALIEALKELRGRVSPVSGLLALLFARELHEHGLDDPKRRWGNAYFRCGLCGAATDCEGAEFFNHPHTYNAVVSICHDCGEFVTLGDLRLSETWLEGL